VPSATAARRLLICRREHSHVNPTVWFPATRSKSSPGELLAKQLASLGDFTDLIRKIVHRRLIPKRPASLQCSVKEPFRVRKFGSNQRSGIAVQLTRMNARSPAWTDYELHGRSVFTGSGFTLDPEPSIRGSYSRTWPNTLPQRLGEPTISSNMEGARFSSVNATVSFRMRSSARLRSSMSVAVANHRATRHVH